MKHLYAPWVVACTLLCAAACTSPEPPANGLSRVRAHLPKEPRRLFPLLAASSYESQVNDLVYQYLLHFDPTTEELAPQLAESFPQVSQTDEGTSYTFSLREGARWSDGRPVTADDVAFTFKAVFFPGFSASPYRGSVRELQRVEVASPREFTLYTTGNNLNGAAYYGNVPILPEHVYDEALALRTVDFETLLNADNVEELPAALQDFADDARVSPFGKTVVTGSGPYRLADWEEGQYVRLVRDSTFWGANLSGGLFLANPDTIEFVPVPDATTALTMLENGDLDVLPNVQPREAVRLRDEVPEFDLYTPLQLTRTFVYLNTKDSKLADVDTRRGLAHLLDIEGFLRDVQLGFGRPLYGPYHPAQEYARLGNRPVDFDVDAARAAFERAGWSDSDGDGILDKRIFGEQQDLALEYLYPSVSKSSEALALLYAADAAKAGVKITPVGMEYRALLGNLARRDFQLVQGAIGSEPLPEDPYGLWHTDSDSPRGKNRAGFGNAATDALIDSIRVNLDPTSRREQYGRLAEAINDEQPVIFLIVPQERIAVRSTLAPIITARRPGYYLPGFTSKN